MTPDEVKAKLVELSKNGSAWIATQGFGEVSFKEFSSPCKIPDYYIDLTWKFDRKIGYKGKLIDFAKAAVIREQNRGMGNA
jgi:hypothetical protein